LAVWHFNVEFKHHCALAVGDMGARCQQWRGQSPGRRNKVGNESGVSVPRSLRRMTIVADEQINSAM
jgi:hypothetical protein